MALMVDSDCPVVRLKDSDIGSDFVYSFKPKRGSIYHAVAVEYTDGNSFGRGPTEIEYIALFKSGVLAEKLCNELTHKYLDYRFENWFNRRDEKLAYEKSLEKYDILLDDNSVIACNAHHLTDYFVSINKFYICLAVY